MEFGFINTAYLGDYVARDDVTQSILGGELLSQKMQGVGQQ